MRPVGKKERVFPVGAGTQKRERPATTADWRGLFAAEEACEFGGGEREAGAAAGNEIDVARDVELANFEFFHPAVFDFPSNAHTRDDGNSHAHLHEAFDAFDSGHFDGHV